MDIAKNIAKLLLAGGLIAAGIIIAGTVDINQGLDSLGDVFDDRLRAVK